MTVRVRKALARFNRDHLNRVMLALAPVPPFAALIHRGRKTGREYRIVLNAWKCGDRFAFALPYGADSDWVRNVVANGAAELEWRRARIHLHRPVPPVFFVYRAFGVDEFLLMDRAGDEAA